MNKLVACAFLLSAFCGSAWAQNAGDPAEVDRLLNCIVDDEIPETPAVADQGGYLFEYQSFRGTMEDDRACTMYRLRNTSEKPPMPFRWTIGGEAVVDKARLGCCREKNGDCPWITFVKYFAGQIDTNLSSISYGLNADAFREQVTTYMNRFGVDESEVAQETGTTASSVGTEIVGSFVTEDESVVDIHLVVKSRFALDAAGDVELIYELDDLSGRGGLGSESMRIAWDAFASIEPVATPIAAADSTGTDELTVAGVGSLTRSDDMLAIAIPVRDFVLDQTFSFRVFAPDDDVPVVSGQTPAYVPSPRRP